MMPRKLNVPARWLAAALGIPALLAAGSAPAAAGGFPPDQPYASFWFPNDLLSWSPATDPDAAFNRSNVALASRFLYPATQVNPHARPGEGRVAALSIMYPTTSFNPSQGSLDFDVYAFNYWQYVDLLVFWGGSAGEGLILAPNPGVIDAAHRNGVRVLGNIFLPPLAFGGDIQWVFDLVQQVDGTFPVGDKLIEVAEYYGFDGWFINQETAGGNTALATDIRDLIRYIHDHSDLHIQWYDAMIENGQIIYQNALTANNDAFLEESGPVSDSMFLNYNWSAAGLGSSRALAQALGHSPYELYAGVNVQANGYNSPVNWNGLFPEGQPHQVSLGFFGANWTFSSTATPAEFYQEANRFWVGANRDPSDTTTGHPWKGVAHYVPAYSPIDEVPFVTNFNTGQGSLYAIDGEVLRLGEWNNRGLQDVLPTWRWLLTSTGTELSPELDWSDAYNGGTSLKIAGDLTDRNDLQLFKTKLPIATGRDLHLVYKTGSAGTPSNLRVGLAFEDGGGLSDFEFLDVGSTASAGWNTAVFDLSPFAGEILAVLSLRFEAGSPALGYEVRIGRIAVVDGVVDTPLPPSTLLIDTKDELDPETATLRLRWDHSPDPVYSYNVYRRNPDDSLTYLGGTANNAYFVAEVERAMGESGATIEVEAVGLEFGRSAHATASFLWDDPLAIFADGFESGDTGAWSQTAP